MCYFLGSLTFYLEVLLSIVNIVLVEKKLDWCNYKLLHWFTSALTHNLQKFDEVITCRTCSNIRKCLKKLNWIREPPITYSHIWHVDISKCLHQSDTQSVKVWCRYYNSDMNNTVTFGMLTYQNVYINQTHNLWKFGVDTIIQTWIIVNYVWKYTKNAIKSRSFP